MTRNLPLRNGPFRSIALVVFLDAGNKYLTEQLKARRVYFGSV